MKVYEGRRRKSDWWIRVAVHDPEQSYQTFLYNLRIVSRFTKGRRFIPISHEADLIARRLIEDAMGSKELAREHSLKMAQAHYALLFAGRWTIRQEDIIAWIDAGIPIGEL